LEKSRGEKPVLSIRRVARQKKTNLKVGTGRKCEEKYFLAPGVVREQVIYTPFERFMGA